MQRKQAEDRDTARVFAMALEWLKTPAIQAQWQPRMEDNTTERSSSICIRFRHKPGKSEELILQRQRALQGALKMVNEILDRCWEATTPFRRSEIEISCYRRRDGEWTGMIVIAVRTDLSQTWRACRASDLINTNRRHFGDAHVYKTC